MSEVLRAALSAGSARLAAWSDLLDRINVFPVADGDTGRNLVISLTPLRDAAARSEALVEQLLLAARGNSGNIASRFLSGVLTARGADPLADGVRAGRELAWQAVAEPKAGTMLSLFDALVEALEEDSRDPEGRWVDRILDRLERAVESTREQLPRLKQAGVVDAGALGMFIFFDGALNTLRGRPEAFRPIERRFGPALSVSGALPADGEAGFCVDAVLRTERSAEALAAMEGLGESVVAITQGGYLKVHLHTGDRDRLRECLGGLGAVVAFESDDMGQQARVFPHTVVGGALHLMTDAAGSLTRADALRLGLTLLDSYVQLGARSVPETRLPPGELYQAMKAGVRVSTAQASVFERHQHYRKALESHPRVLYLATGSAFTGNYQVALDWKLKHDPDNRLQVLDSQAASGRLGLMALAVAERALAEPRVDEVVEFARRCIAACEEYVFLDQLKYLAAGGRLSKASAFFGDLLHMKPVVSPQADGARKVAVLRSRDDGVMFALQRLSERLDAHGGARALLQYTDNREWVEAVPAAAIRAQHPGVELRLQPVSLTSGAHMGPGTWALAFLPQLD